MMDIFFLPDLISGIYIPILNLLGICWAEMNMGCARNVCGLGCNGLI
jgi:hypothetical protein